MSITVDISALDSAAAELEAEAAALQAADVAGPFEPIGAALPGTQTAEAAVWVSTRIGAAVQVMGDQVRAMSASATGSAQAYRDTDATTSHRFGGVPQ
jgi:hypothetical protein